MPGVWFYHVTYPLDSLLCKQKGCDTEKYLVVGLGSALGSTLFGQIVPALFFWVWYETGSLGCGIYPTLLFEITRGSICV